MIGPEELQALSSPFSFRFMDAPEIPFSTDLLRKVAATHILILSPKTYGDGSPIITLRRLRDLFGIDPAVFEPCMYGQDWYLNEQFATNVGLDGQWHLMRKNVCEDMRSKRPEEIETLLECQRFPTSVVCAFTFFAWWLYTGGEMLWKNDFLWCSDRDHNGDRIYVGRYEDPACVNKNGFNIHRHLTLRPAYSAAPEIVACEYSDVLRS